MKKTNRIVLLSLLVLVAASYVGSILLLEKTHDHAEIYDSEIHPIMSELVGSNWDSATLNRFFSQELKVQYKNTQDILNFQRYGEIIGYYDNSAEFDYNITKGTFDFALPVKFEESGNGVIMLRFIKQDNSWLIDELLVVFPEETN